MSRTAVLDRTRRRMANQPMTDAIAIEAVDVSVAFPNPQTGARDIAVDRVSFEVGRGEFVSLVGPSGCGKTTLINMIAGFIAPDEGSLRIEGKPVRGIQWREIAMMFARDTLLPWRTARQNVELAFELSHGHDASARAQYLLELVGLGPYGNFFPSQLSQGMRQRVALARTLAANRSVMLMDEPFAALDAQTKTLIQAEFTRIWEADRKTVILVTHDLMEAIALSDRVVVMSPRPGRLKSVHRIELPRPRVIIDLPSDPQFLDLYRRLWDELKGELPGSTGVAA